ncbi:acyl-CoA thioesterase II [Aurantivibrio plasticivorans]
MTEKNPFSLLDLLDVDPLEDNMFLGHRVDMPGPRVFGGQVLGQALMAASKTVAPEKLVHSSHNYFIRPGDNALPIHYQVWLDLDGRSFSNRRVVASQNGKPILNLTASFQAPEGGLHHQLDAPEIDGPDGLLNENELGEKYRGSLPDAVYEHLNHYRPIEVRPVDEAVHFLTIEPTTKQAMWFRAKESAGNNLALQRSILAYATDLALLSTCGRPHEVTWTQGNVRTASIDHALWIHTADVRTEEWLLYLMDSPWSGSARGLNRGSIYTQSGELVASVAQEGLMRIVE